MESNKYPGANGKPVGYVRPPDKNRNHPERILANSHEYHSNGGPQTNYSGDGQFINHGEASHVNTGAGNYTVHQHRETVSSPTENSARAMGEARVFNRQTLRKNPFRSAQFRNRTDTEILEWARSLDEDQLTRLTQDGKAEWVLRDLQRVTYSPECDSSLKENILKFMILLSEASGCCIQSHHNPNVRKLGESPLNPNGTFADMWKGKIGEGPEMMALKIVKQEHVSEVSETIKTHMRDVIEWRMVDHPNVVPFIGSFYFGANPQEMCLVSPLMECNLVEYLAKNQCQTQERLPLVWEVAYGIEYLHSVNITHGNLKGHNILIKTEEGVARALIADFGLYTLYPRSKSGHIRPTPWFAPEVMLKGSFTQKSDIYAFGILCYETFTRCVPFEGLSEDALYKVVVDQKQSPNRSPGADGLIPWKVMERCWGYDPSSRPTAPEVMEDLEGILKSMRTDYM